MTKLVLVLLNVLLSDRSICGEKIIGIDLGTTYCSVAVFKNGKVEIIPDKNGNKITPSYVAFTTSGEILIGHEAKAQIISNPENTIHNVKRIIGRKWDDKLVQQDIRLFSFKVSKVDNKPQIGIKFNGKIELYTPEMITAMLLERMKEIAEDYLGEEIASAVITTPAYFNEDQRQATKDAGQLAGLKVKRILSEPTAAAMSCSFLSMRGVKKVLVFDIGGGTFDVSVIEQDDGHFRVLATRGDTNLGGEDFSQRLLKYLIKYFKDKTGETISRSQFAIQKLRREVERVKRTLSLRQEAIVDTPNLYKGSNLTVTITRKTFEELNKDLLDSTMQMVKDVLKDSGLNRTNIDDVVLVGGSSRIVEIQQMLENYFSPTKIRRDVDPEEAVAYGAAVQAAVLMNVKDTEEIVLLDAYPFSLGYEVDNGTMHTVIHRNTNIPCEKENVVTTTIDYQEKVSIKVYRGEYNRTNSNFLLANLILDGIHLAKKGVPEIKIKFEINVNGILNVTARDIDTKKHAKIVIDNTYEKLTDTELAEMRLKMFTFRYNEMAKKDRLEARDNLEKLIYIILHFIQRKKYWLQRNFHPNFEELNQQKTDFDAFLSSLYKIKADTQITDRQELKDIVYSIEWYAKQKRNSLEKSIDAKTETLNLEKRQLDEYLKAISGINRSQDNKRRDEL